MTDHADIVRAGLKERQKGTGSINNTKPALAALDALVARAETAEAEVARLREALQQIAQASGAYDGQRKIARAALAAEETTSDE